MPCAAVIISLFPLVPDSCHDIAPADGGVISRFRRNQRWRVLGMPCIRKLGSGRQVGRQAGGWLLYALACVVADVCLFVKSTNCENPAPITKMTTMPLEFLLTFAAAGEKDLAIQHGELRGQRPAGLPTHAGRGGRHCSRSQELIGLRNDGGIWRSRHGRRRDVCGMRLVLRWGLSGEWVVAVLRWPACAYRRPWWCGRREQEQQHERTPRGDCDSTQRNVR